jgi:bacteriocin-like protein
MFRHPFSPRSSAMAPQTRSEVHALQSTPGAAVAGEAFPRAGMPQPLARLTDTELATITGGWMMRGPLWGSITVAEA